LELAKGQLIGVARLEVSGRERRRKTMEPAPEEGVHGSGTESVADALEGGRIGAPAEAVVERLVRDASLVQLALGPAVAVEPQPDRVGCVGVGLPEGWAPFGIPQSGKEVTSRAPPPPRTGRDGHPVIQLRLCARSNPWPTREHCGGTPGDAVRACEARRCHRVLLP